MVRVGNISQIDKFFTDRAVPQQALEAFANAGVEVRVAGE
jgi:DeoR/GlpR family transcriptional regulator of sugar metabolism